MTMCSYDVNYGRREQHSLGNQWERVEKAMAPCSLQDLSLLRCISLANWGFFITFNYCSVFSVFTSRTRPMSSSIKTYQT